MPLRSSLGLQIFLSKAQQKYSSHICVLQEIPHAEILDPKVLYVTTLDKPKHLSCASAQRDKTKVFCYSWRKSLETKRITTLSWYESAAKELLIFNNESISETFEDGRTMIRFQVSFQTGELPELWRTAQLHRRFWSNLAALPAIITCPVEIKKQLKDNH